MHTSRFRTSLKLAWIFLRNIIVSPFSLCLGDHVIVGLVELMFDPLHRRWFRAGWRRVARSIIYTMEEMKWDESGFRPPLCTYWLNWARRTPPEDSEMIEMTLSSKTRIRNSSPGGLRPSTLPFGHGGSPQYWLSHVDGEETFFVSFKPPRPGTEPRTLAWKAAVLTTTLGPPPYTMEEKGTWCFNRVPDCHATHACVPGSNHAHPA